MTSSPLAQLHRKLIVSCQAWEDDAFFAPGEMARFARAALEGGAGGIRANGPEDVAKLQMPCALPVLGISEEVGRRRTNPNNAIVEDARRFALAGAACIALDCTTRGRHYGALDRLQKIKSELGIPVAADIATLEDATSAAAAGADFVLSTMRGYTADTAGATSFDIKFIQDLVRNAGVPVIAEGRIWTPEQAVAALDAGAFAVVVGSAITRPRDITARYSSAIQSWSHDRSRCFVGVDLGATNIKYGLVNGDGVLTHRAARRARPTEQRRFCGK